MATNGIFKRALASCRRVLVLLLLGFTLLGAWFYWQSPNLDTMEPIVEKFLKENMQLQNVSLGKLSWSWSGYLWLQAEHLDFTTRDNLLAYHGGRLAVRMTLAALLAGDLAPDRIRLSGGKMNMHLTNTAAAPVPGRQLILDDVELHWRYETWQGQLPKLHLLLDSDKLSLEASSPALRLSARLGDDGFIRQLNLHSSDIAWLPGTLRSQIQGDPVVDLDLQHIALHQWRLKASVNSEQALAVMPEKPFTLSFNRLAAEFQIKMKETGKLEFEQVDIRSLDWALAKNAVAAKGMWKRGKLQLDIESDRLPMPLIWSWLRPLGEQEFHQWLERMQSGAASNIKAHAALSWPRPWAAWPQGKAWETMQYSVAGQIDDADISLGADNEFVRRVSGRVRLNQDALDAHIATIELPHRLGKATGELHLPWSSLELQISGQAETEVTRLIDWAYPGEISDMKWRQSKSSALFKLRWNPEEDRPRQASMTLKPKQAWELAIGGIELRMSDGLVHWDQDRKGIRVSNMNIAGKYMRGIASFNAVPAHAGKWEISTFDGKISGDFAALSAYIQLPLANARGALSTTLHYDGDWSGMLDLTDAGWDRLLGSSKDAGKSFFIRYQGEVETRDGKQGIRLSRLESSSKPLQFHGNATISREAFTAHIDNLHTPAFNGSLDLRAPIGADQPWEAEVEADYLNRNALPDAVDYAQHGAGKQWVFRGRIKRFDWDDARMSGVLIKLASAADSAGIFEAAQIHTRELDFLDVNARFSLPGWGKVDLHSVNASVEQQHFSMSATLTPGRGGGMHWHGFVEMSGNFGHLMKRGELSSRFQDGESHILFSGQGVILHDQPWWQGLDGRLRLRVDKGRILEGGTMTTFLAATNLSDLPGRLIGRSKDLSGPGTYFERLQMEAIMQDQNIRIRNVALRSSAFDLVGHGTMDVDQDMIDLYLIAHPLQNLDAILSKLPLIRDILGGKSHSFMRKVYRMHGPFSNADVELVNPEDAGLASPGIIEGLFSLPDRWFGKEKRKAEAAKDSPDKAPR
jgi:hypothetical protein